MSGRRGFPSERWSHLDARTCADPDEAIYFGSHAESDDEGSLHQVSRSLSARLIVACGWASFAHRLLLKQQLQSHVIYRGGNSFEVAVRQLQALARGEHPLSTVDKVEFYLGTPPLLSTIGPLPCLAS
jgi:hypothetical protein